MEVGRRRGNSLAITGIDALAAQMTSCVSLQLYLPPDVCTEGMRAQIYCTYLTYMSTMRDEYRSKTTAYKLYTLCFIDTLIILQVCMGAASKRGVARNLFSSHPTPSDHSLTAWFICKLSKRPRDDNQASKPRGFVDTLPLSLHPPIQPSMFLIPGHW